MAVASLADLDEALDPDLHVAIPEVAPGHPHPQLAYKNNNPGNVEYVHQPGAEPGADGRFARFATPEAGLADVHRVIGLHQNDTLEQYLNTYAPASENDTDTYLGNAEKALGVKRDTVLSKIDRAKLAEFQIGQESSSKLAHVASLADLEPVVSQSVDGGDKPTASLADLEPAPAPSLLERGKALLDQVKGVAGQVADAAQRPGLGFARPGTGKEVVGPWKEAAKDFVDEATRPIEAVPGGSWLRRALHEAVDKGGDAAAGALEFVTSPLGIATAPAAAGEGLVAGGVRSIMAGQQAPKAVEDVAAAVQNPTPENVAGAAVSTIGAAAPMAPEIAAGAGRAVEAGRDAAGALERHNVEAERLVEQERRAGQGTQAAQDTLGDDQMPVKVGDRTLIVRAAGGEAKTGRPFYQVVDDQGKTLFGGFGQQVQEYLRQQGAAPSSSAPPTVPSHLAIAGRSYIVREVKPGQLQVVDTETGKVNFTGSQRELTDYVTENHAAPGTAVPSGTPKTARDFGLQTGVRPGQTLPPEPEPVTAPAAAAKPPKVSVPETGIPENVARAVDARDRLAQDLAGKPFKDLSNSERLVVDEFVSQGYGTAVQGDKSPAQGDKSPAQGEIPSQTGSLADVEPVQSVTPESAKAPDNISDLGKTTTPAPATASAESAPKAGINMPENMPAQTASLADIDEEEPTSLSSTSNEAPKPEEEPQPGNKITEIRPAARAPSVAPAFGAQAKVSIPGTKTEYPVRYAVMEAADVQASHNAQNFEPNPAYQHQNDRDYTSTENAARVVDTAQNFRPEFVLTKSPTAELGTSIVDENGNVLGGNNRAMALQRVYQSGNAESAQEYRDELVKNANQFGLDPAELARFKNPILVRQATTATPEAAANAITDFNKPSAAALKPSEQAVADGRRLSVAALRTITASLDDLGEEGTLAQALRGDNGQEILNRLVADGVITTQEKNGYLDEREQLTPEIKDRIAKALVGRLFKSPKELTRTTPETRSKLERIAPQLLRIEGRAGWGLTEPVKEALTYLEELRARGAKTIRVDVSEGEKPLRALANAGLFDNDRIPSLIEQEGKKKGQLTTEGKATAERLFRENQDNELLQAGIGQQKGSEYSPIAKAIARKLQEGPLAAARAFRMYANDESMSREGAQTTLYQPPTQKEAFDAAFGPTEHGKPAGPEFPVSQSLDRPTPGFYSQLERVVEAKVPSRAPAGQVLSTITNPQNGVTADEIKWSGIDDWLKEKGTKPVTKQEVQEFVRENATTLQEVTKGEPPASFENYSLRDGLDRATKFGKYTTPGGEHYRELLLVLPPKAAKPGAPSRTAAILELMRRQRALTDELTAGPTTDEEHAHIVQQISAVGAELDRQRNPNPGYKSGHWEEENVVAHIRMDDRVGDDGAKILHVAEIQSDWHQEGRKKGYAPPAAESQAARAEIARLQAEKPTEEQLRTLPEGYVVAIDRSHPEHPYTVIPPGQVHGQPFAGRHESKANAIAGAVDRILYEEKQRKLIALRNKLSGGVPDAPFKKSWPELAFKRVLRYAAENGYDRVTWDTGTTNADRYDLSHQVDEVRWNERSGDFTALKDGEVLVQRQDVGAPELEDLIGKEVARKLIEQKPATVHPFSRVLRGRELKVEAPGMVGFYDKILPAFANKYGKKWGAKVTEESIPAGVPPHFSSGYANGVDDSDGYGVYEDGEMHKGPVAKFATEAEAQQYIQGQAAKVTVHAIPVTDAMRASVMQGQPLFMRARPGLGPKLARSAGEIPTWWKTIVDDARWTTKTGPLGTTFYVNEETAQTLRTAVFENKRWQIGEFLGMHMDQYVAHALADAVTELAEDYKEKERDVHSKIESLADSLRKATNEKHGLVMVKIRETPAEQLPSWTSAPTFTPRTLGQTVATLRHERIHAAQSEFSGSPGVMGGPSPPAPSHISSYDAHQIAQQYPQLRERLTEKGYGAELLKDSRIVVTEAAAHIGAGQGLGMTIDQDVDFLDAYFRALETANPEKSAAVILRRMTASVRGAYAQEVEVRRAGKPPDTGRPRHLLEQEQDRLEEPPARVASYQKGGARDDDEARRRREELGSLFGEETEGQVDADTRRDRDQLTGAQLTAQLNAPVSREEQLKRLRRSKAKPQTSMFEESEPEAQSDLFGSSPAPSEPAAAPSGKVLTKTTKLYPDRALQQHDQVRSILSGTPIEVIEPGAGKKPDRFLVKADYAGSSYYGWVDADTIGELKPQRGLFGDESGSAKLSTLTLGLDKFIEQDIAPTIEEAARTIAQASDDVLKILVPVARGGGSTKLAALILRNRLAELARQSDRAEAALSTARTYFQKQGDAGGRDFILKYFSDENAQLPQTGDKNLDGIARVLRNLLDGRRDEVQSLGSGKLNKFYTNYFPRVWKDWRRAEGIFASFYGRRPLEGGKGFLKQRKHVTIEDALDAGLEPVSWNPIDLVLLKVREMDRYLMAHRTLEDWKRSGIVRYIDAREGKAPAGWMKVADPIGTIYGPSVQDIMEYPNADLYAGLGKVADALGIKHERKFGPLRHGNAVGLAHQGGLVETVHGSAEQVLAHEIGHQIDWLAGSGRRFVTNYPSAESVARIREARRVLGTPGSSPDARKAANKTLRDMKPDIQKRKQFQSELRALADLRYGGERKAYTHKREEKMALLAEMWVGARELFQKTAPMVFDEWKQFLQETPKLEALRDIQAGTDVAGISQPYDVGGLVIRGHWWAPEGAARILNNYLSPSLRTTSGVYKAVLGANNVLNQFQLGMSGFHLGFTSGDAAVSRAALGFENLMRGRPVAAAKAFASVPLSPITNFFAGNKLLREWYKPGSEGGAIAKIVEGLVAAGGRARMDAIYGTAIGERMTHAFRNGNIWGGLIRAPFAGVEAISNVMMKEIVPRQKLGVFADLARFELERLGPEATFEQTRAALAAAWDSVENRMGEMTYDNLFWNRTTKDLAMLGVRSVGWNLGTIREVGGGAVDLVKVPIQLAGGSKPPAEVNIHRIAYLMGLVTVSAVMGAVYQYLRTGKGPEELKDYFFPKTGQLDSAGRPDRAAMPTYVKDVYHYATEPGKTIANKVAPIWSVFAEMVRNEDFYGTEIRGADDPIVEQMKQLATYAGKSAEPFGIRNLERDRQMRNPTVDQVGRFVGIQPAPAAIEKTKAERLASELAQEHIPAGSRTHGEAERRDAEQAISRLARSRKDYSGQAREYVERGVLTAKDAHAAAIRSQTSPLLRTSRSLPLGDLLRVWKAATPEERDELRPLLKRHLSTAKDLPPAQRQMLIPKLQAALSE